MIDYQELKQLEDDDVDINGILQELNAVVDAAVAAKLEPHEISRLHKAVGCCKY